ncbi:MAG: acetylornithine/N-succinyldiaminopimelate aminotransferase [Gammaproteobacteria bacterium]|jgi:acetylornithine/N-succinyldiaminopimelate aminotransferase
MSSVKQINQHLLPITARPDAIMVRGEGSWLFDDADRRYLDLIQGWAVNALGHCPAEITSALHKQGTTLITPSPALHNAPQLALAQRLTVLSGLAQVHFANSGGEANEAAVKLARKWGQKHKGGAFEIITTHGAFHGRTLAMMAASGKPGWDQYFPPMPTGFPKVAFGDAQAVADAIGDDTVAIMLEPIQGEAGVIMPPPGYLTALRALADQHDLLLIFDEVQTGIGRTGTLFAAQHEDIIPDIMTLGKGLGGGVPISAVLATSRAASFEYGDQGGTYNGNPLMTAVALAVLDTVAEAAFLAHVRDVGSYLCEQLLSLGERHRIEEVRGRGLLCALRLTDEIGNEVRDLAFERGLLINAPRADTLRFMPSLRLSRAEVDEAVVILDECLTQAA